MSNAGDPSRSVSARKNLTWLGLIGIAAVVLIFSSYRGRFGPAGSRHPAVGRPLAELEFVPLTAAEPIASRDWRGRVVLINFWGTWCGPCRQEFPHLAQMYDRFCHNPDFRFVSVSYPAGADDGAALATRTRQFVEEVGGQFATYADPGGTNLSRVVMTAGLPSGGIPITVVLDRQSHIRGVWQGYRPGDEQHVEQLLAELL